jgi:gliding motility-associated-like protein
VVTNDYGGYTQSCGNVITVTFDAVDACTNAAASVSSTITFNDVTPPTAICQDITVQLDATGNITITALDIDNGSSDNCLLDTMWLDVYDFDCADIGPNVVNLTVEDACGLQTTCTATVTVEDDAPPIITCPSNRNENVDGSGNFTIPDYTGLVTVTDNCNPAPTLTQNPVTGTVINGVGTVQTITISADDGNGNSAQCQFDITLDASLPLTILCPGDRIEYVDGNCEFSIPDYRSLATVTGDTGVTQLPLIGTILSGHGTVQTITLTAHDGAGNTESCTFDVSLADTISPNIACPNDSTIVAPAGDCNMVVDGIAPLLTGDNCGINSLTYRLEGASSGTGSNDASGAIFNEGVTTVWYKIDDVNGNADSCSFNITILITSMPPDNAFADRDTICENDGDITLSYSGGDTGSHSTAVWYSDASFTTVVGTGNDLMIAAPAVTTTYFVRFESICDTSSSVSVTISVITIPVPTFLEKTEIACINGPLYRYIAGGQTGSTFIWSITNGTIVNNYNDTILVDWGAQANSGTLELIEISTAGCVSFPESLTVAIDEPSLELGEDIGICRGESVTVTPEGDFVSYLWHDGSTGSEFTTDQEGLISVEVTDANGCSTKDSLNAYFVELPVVDLGPDTSVCGEEGLVLDAGTDGDSYRWSTGDISQQITVYEYGDQEIWVEVENSFGCVGSDTVLIEECDIYHLFDPPTAFTPNGDGVNDVWNLYDLQEFSQAEVEIYDQWGTLVWKSEPGYSEPWDGIDMKGRPMPVDSYHYVVYFNDGSDETYVGYVTVIK